MVEKWVPLNESGREERSDPTETAQQADGADRPHCTKGTSASVCAAVAHRPAVRQPTSEPSVPEAYEEVMPGRPPKVDHVKISFLSEIKSAEDLVAKINSFKGGINPAGKKGLHPKHVRQVVELAFMGAVASWEEFLELVMVRYVAGAKTKGGYAPTPKFGQATSLAHAYQVLANNPKFNSSRDCLKVNDPKWVTSTADFLFGAHGFGDIKTNAVLLGHATAIRNRVAHSSEKCRSDFKATAVYFLAPTNGTLKQGYGPGDLLMAPVARHFGPTAVRAKKTHFAAYMDLVRSLANKVVP